MKASETNAPQVGRRSVQQLVRLFYSLKTELNNLGWKQDSSGAWFHKSEPYFTMTLASAIADAIAGKPNPTVDPRPTSKGEKR